MSPRERTGLPEGVVPLALGAVALLALFLNLEPLLTFAAWGSDSGEYTVLTGHLLAHGGFLLSGYTGWGFGYPYFPGMFEIGAATAAVTGTDPLLSLEIAVPALASLAVVPVYLLFRRLYPSDVVALFGAGLTGVVFPRVFVLSHAAPASLGDLLAVAGLWLLLEQRKDPRWMVPLALVSGALIETHHLSSYFFFLSALGLVVGLELYAPCRWSKRFPVRELAYLAAFVVVLLTYWIGYAPPFEAIVEQGLLGAPLLLAPLLGIGGVAGGGVLIAVRRRGLFLHRRPLWRLRLPTWAAAWRDATVLLLLLGAGIAYLLFLPLPGTSDVVPFSDVVYFLPFLLFVPLAAGARRIGTLARAGTGPVVWFGAIACSATFAIKTANAAIPPARHVEYLALPLILMAAIVVGGVVAELRVRYGTPGLVTGLVACGLLLASNAAVAYPPPALLEGFQEGFTPGDVALASWASVALPGGSTLASDHRLSDLYFGFSGRGATWSAAPCLFVGADQSCALAELRNLSFPLAKFAPRALDAVAIDQVMVEQGTALNPNAPALPMSASALNLLRGPGFVELYDNGDQVVWWVDAPALPSGSG